MLVLRRLLPYLAQYKGPLALGMVCLLFGKAASVLAPQVLRMTMLCRFRASSAGWREQPAGKPPKLSWTWAPRHRQPRSTAQPAEQSRRNETPHMRAIAMARLALRSYGSRQARRQLAATILLLRT